MLFLICLASAQTVDANIPAANGQLFRPSIDSTHTLWADDSLRAPDGYFLTRGVAHYARDPVLYVEKADGEVTRIIGDLFQLSVLGGFTTGPIRLGVDVPVYLRTLGDAGGETGLGDVSLDLKGTAVDRRTHALGLAFSARASLPTATVQAPLGNRGFGWELQGILDKEVDGLLVTTNVGVKGVPEHQLENFTWGTQLVARIGTGYAMTQNAGLSLDFGAHVNLVDPVPEAVPVEGIVGAWGRTKNVVVRGGLGTALSPGFGAPKVRAILSLSYEPDSRLHSEGYGDSQSDDSHTPSR